MWKRIHSVDSRKAGLQSHWNRRFEKDVGARQEERAIVEIPQDGHEDAGIPASVFRRRDLPLFDNTRPKTVSPRYTEGLPQSPEARGIARDSHGLDRLRRDGRGLAGRWSNDVLEPRCTGATTARKETWRCCERRVSTSYHQGPRSRRTARTCSLWPRKPQTDSFFQGGLPFHGDLSEKTIVDLPHHDLASILIGNDFEVGRRFPRVAKRVERRIRLKLVRGIQVEQCQSRVHLDEIGRLTAAVSRPHKVRIIRFEVSDDPSPRPKRRLHHNGRRRDVSDGDVHDAEGVVAAREVRRCRTGCRTS